MDWIAAPQEDHEEQEEEGGEEEGGEEEGGEAGWRNFRVFVHAGGALLGRPGEPLIDGEDTGLVKGKTGISSVQEEITP